MDYGAIGAIIGHEISHSFDDQGALFDASGRLSNWWTKEDFAHFEASSRAARRRSSTGTAPSRTSPSTASRRWREHRRRGRARGRPTTRTGSRSRAARRPVVEGLTGDQQFFLSFAQSWRQKIREPALRQRLLTDGHAPAEYRADTVRNLDAWYRAFDVKAGQALYLAPADRVRIW